jgi:porin
MRSSTDRRTPRPRRHRLALSVASLCAAAALPAWAQEDGATPQRQGPELQAEGQDVAGGLEPQPSETFDPAGHLLGDLGGVRAQLAERGISIDPLLTVDYAKNFRGGNDTAGDAFLHVFNLYLTVETGPLFGLQGGTFYADLLTQNGQSPSDEVGDYSLVDELDFGGRTQVNEVWYEQKLLDDKLRIKVGKIDANTEFCFAENSFDFSNGGLNYGFPNTQFNFMPTAPDPMLGGVVSVAPVESVYVNVGVFDGALLEGRDGDDAPDSLFGAPADLYLAAEIGTTFDVRGTPWRVAVGAAHHTGTFTQFDDGSDEDGNTSFYALVDAKLWKENPGDDEDEQGLGAFFVYDTADSELTEVDQHFAGGLAWTGALPGRDDDVVGLGATYSHFAGGAGFEDTGELAVEAFYKIAITDYLSVKADLQYIKDPGGAGLEDAVVGLVRVQVAF